MDTVIKFGTFLLQGILLFLALLGIYFFLWALSPTHAYALDCNTVNPKHESYNPNGPNLAYNQWLCNHPVRPAHPCDGVRSPDGTAVAWYKCMSAFGTQKPADVCANPENDYVRHLCATNAPPPTPTPTPEPRSEGTVIVPESEMFHPESGDTYKAEYEKLEAEYKDLENHYEHLVVDRNGWEVRAVQAEGWQPKLASLTAEVERLRRRCGRRCR